MIAKDVTLGKYGRGVFFLILCPLLFWGVSAKLFLSADNFYRQEDMSIAILYFLLSMACSIYGLYIAYCLYFTARTARVVSFSGEGLKIKDYVGRIYYYSAEAMVSCEPYRVDILLRKFVLFGTTNTDVGMAGNLLAIFKDGRRIIISSNMKDFDAILANIRSH
ncbi:MAG: hypothetical protein V7696_13330 [Halioglobus sp.]